MFIIDNLPVDNEVSRFKYKVYFQLGGLSLRSGLVLETDISSPTTIFTAQFMFPIANFLFKIACFGLISSFPLYYSL